jgi:hypothetical protein
MALRLGASRLAALAFAAVGCAETIGSETIAPHPDVCGPRSGRGSPHTFAAPERRGAAAQDLDVHPVIDAYRESLRSFLDAREAAMLDQVDWSGTTGGDTQRLRDLAADRALRRILPLLLESERSPVLDAHAARLRALPPRLNRDTDVVAHLAVAEAMAALERFSAAASARLHGVSEIRGAATASAAADAVDVGFLVGRVLENPGALRERVLGNPGVLRERVLEEAPWCRRGWV